MDKLMDELGYAKDAVKWLLDHVAGNVDCHGLVYWAEEVERLREEIKKGL
jgi:hypothetical protein